MRGCGRFGQWVKAVLMVVWAGSVLGCGAKVQSTKLYLMDYEPIIRQAEEARGPLPYRVQVRDFKIPRTFDRTRIVYRYSPHELNYYRYYQWAVPPRVMITDLVEGHIAASGMFEIVRREFWDERPDYEITGTIAALEKFESGDFGGAHLAMKMELIRSSDNATVVAHEFDREVELRNPAMTFFAQKLSEILEGEVEIFLQAIDLYFYPPEAEEEPEDLPVEPFPPLQ
ncbi:MAG: membrane integrity-associated transporter subunit PqiC [Candidatus Eisenbacteria sp.]|nr:membrane integrity-associated transporter subunit PqiC [Candidatus Eisenbacteria bacterium]